MILVNICEEPHRVMSLPALSSSLMIDEAESGERVDATLSRLLSASSGEGEFNASFTKRGSPALRGEAPMAVRFWKARLASSNPRADRVAIPLSSLIWSISSPITKEVIPV